MKPAAPQEVTRILDRCRDGDAAAADELLGLVYDELRRLAAGQMRGERVDHTLQATALAHEAYLRLLGEETVRWENRAHFFGAAAEVMRRILIDHARGRLAEKRGGGRERVPLDDASTSAEEDPEALLAIDEALRVFEREDPERAEIVKLRFFAGLTVEVIAELQGVTDRTIRRQWRYAKAWLYREMGH